MRTPMKRLMFATFALSFAACGAPIEDASNDDDVIIADGKEDDFFASSAKEYFVSGSSTVTIEDTLATATAAKKLQRAKELVSFKNVAIGWFLNVYLTDKEDED